MTAAHHQSQHHTGAAATAARPVSVYESSPTSPDVLVALGKDFGRADLCQAREVFADAKRMAGVTAKKMVTGARTVLRLSRDSARRIAGAMGESSPAQAKDFRDQLADPAPYGR